jgi:uncharacterized protein (TIRG00374 family)
MGLAWTRGVSIRCMNEEFGTKTADNTRAPQTQTRRVRVRIALSYALAIACLVWVLHDYDFSDVLRRVATMNLLLVMMAITCDVLSFVCQGLRWRLLLLPFGSILVLRATQAIYAGMFVSEVLPLKPGELLRAYLVSRWTSVKLATAVTSIVIERLFDGFWLAAAFVVTLILIPLPRRLIEAGDALSVLVLILIGLLIALIWRGTSLRALAGTQVGNGRDSPQRSAGSGDGKRRPVEWSLARSLGALLDRTAVDLRAILYTPYALTAFALSLLILSLQWSAFWLAMLAFGLRISPLAAAAVFVIVHIGTSLPGAPSNIGTYQFFTVLGLTLFGVDKTSAVGFSLVVFVLLSTHIWILGFWALRRSGLTLLGMRTELSKP